MTQETQNTPENELAVLKAQVEALTRSNDGLKADLIGLKEIKRSVEGLGGLDALKSLSEQAAQRAQEAEANRLEALRKESKVTELETHYQGLLSQKDAQLSKFQERAIQKEVDARIAEAIAAEDGNPILLSHLIKNAVKASLTEDGDISISVTGASGESLDASGNPKTIRSIVQDLKSNPDYAGAFRAPNVSGSGSRKSSGTPVADNPFAANTRNVTKQFELIQSNPALATKLAQEAGVSVDW